MLILVVYSGKALPARERWQAGWGGCRHAKVGQRAVCARHWHTYKWIGSEASQVECAQSWHTSFLRGLSFVHASILLWPCSLGEVWRITSPLCCLFLSVHWGLGIPNSLCQWSSRPSWLEDGVGWRWYWCFWERISTIEFLYCLYSCRILSWAYHLCFRQRSLVSVHLL